MAASEPPDKSNREPRSGDDNPFIAFRRFADAQMDALLQGVSGLSSTSERPNRTPNWAPSWVLEAEERLRKTEEARKRNNIRSSEVEGMPRSPGWRARCHRRRDQDTPRQFEEVCATPSAPSMDASEDMHYFRLSHNLSSYLLGSIYSPLHLETNPNQALAKPGNNPAFWRLAFEDLLEHAFGAYDRPFSSPMNVQASQWALTLPKVWAATLSPQQERRYEGEWVPSTGECVFEPAETRRGTWWERWHPNWHLEGQRQENPAVTEDPYRDLPDEAEVLEEPHTELDMYDRFLEKLRSAVAEQEDTSMEQTQTEPPDPVDQHIPPQGSSWEQLMSNKSQSNTQATQTPGQSDASAFQRDGVVATLTTTEHVVMPDGSTRTTVSLRRRFGDGREERKETVHTSHGSESSQKDIEWNGTSWSDDKRPQETGVAKNEAASARGNGKKGWFWS